MNERNHGQGIPWTRYVEKAWYEDIGTVLWYWLACTALGFVVGAIIGMLV